MQSAKVWCGRRLANLGHGRQKSEADFGEVIRVRRLKLSFVEESVQILGPNRFDFAKNFAQIPDSKKS